ncbi:conserved hypothetical protein [uncultured Desulfobacterium sp.]|uniref:1,4-dihydroxy-2-naphthoyl-CoA hydrolase n=1 Tax=uncultured Desulfobacterium sp. TaxID=201089 RepID=A0A445N1X3_9BACT|nr:conserved hypothetical protein [uncultured Desulfobacterium sp.]
MYNYTITIRLHHTDAAGILFYASLFTIAHECYETFLEPEVTFHSMVNELGLIMPIVHAEADYHKPLRVSDRITIRLSLANMGNSSFSLRYDIYTENNEHAATIKTIHVIRDSTGKNPISLPEKLKQKLRILDQVE